MISPERIRSNLDLVRARIKAAGGDPGSVTIVAVTKAWPVDVARAAIAAGLEDLGENYAQELEAKAASLATNAPAGVPKVRWHFIGRLQQNKVKLLAPHVALWQSVDRPEVGRQIARYAPGAAVLVQVNATGEPSKGGCLPARVPALVRELGELGLSVQGLMAVGKHGDLAATADAFRQTVALADQLGLPVRSIGMTDDLEVGVRCGSTMVRVGRVLFGERPPRPADSRLGQLGVGN
ncbi:MAG: YggS family pyridoxal phosphate-dependent enzyme [Acidimicrobiales bacterium]|nr:YggS family pyridoxal phosphate-dependent enzyme [Acidimicrobiales bacterium]